MPQDAEVFEGSLAENLFTAFRDACVISSIHRLNLLDRFDEAIVMSRGRVVAQGAPAALAATSPDFAQLPACDGKERTPRDAAA